MMLFKRKMNKKGTLSDVIITAMLVIAAAIAILIMFKVTSEINDFVQSDSAIGITQEGKTASSTLTAFFPGIIDNSFLLLTVGLGIVAFILAALVRVHPIFIPIFIIALVFVIFMSGVFSNIYQAMAEDPNLLAQANQLTFISNILEFLPIIVGVFGTILMVVMYKTWRVANLD